VLILALLRIARWLNTQTTDTKDLNLVVMQRLTQCTKVHPLEENCRNAYMKAESVTVLPVMSCITPNQPTH